jgi:hypothetical protein
MEFHGSAQVIPSAASAMPRRSDSLKPQFRFESTPPAKAGQIYRISDSTWRRGCRSSSGTWCLTPSREGATANTLHTPAVLDKQYAGCRPIRAPSRCRPFRALCCGCRTSRRFTRRAAVSWLRQQLAAAQAETELFFDSTVRAAHPRPDHCRLHLRNERSPGARMPNTRENSGA